MNSNQSIKLNYFDEDPHDRTKRFYGKNFTKLQNSKILLIGAGALGNEVIKNLAMLDVKHIKLVDFDIVNKSNINRCVFFRENDHLKMKKVDAIKLRLKELNKAIKIETYDCKIQNAPKIVWDVDLVIIGVDNDYARYFINSWLVSNKLDLPVVNGAMGLSFIECEIVVPGKTACLTCLWQASYLQKILNTEVKKNCDKFFIDVLPKFPAISTFTSILGGIMTTEAIKILIGQISIKNTGYLIRLNLDKYEYSNGSIMRNPHCVETMCKAGYEEYKKRTKEIE